MAVFDGVRYALSPSLSPARRGELAAVLDLNGAAPHPPYTHRISLPTHGHAGTDPALKLVTDRWVDRSVVMGKRQSEQYYSPDPAMIFSGVVACATDLAAGDLEVLSAGITALGGQWRTGLTRDVTHLFALRAGSDKYNTALHFAPQTHMCILTPHWFDDAVRLGRRIPEEPYTWPDPPVLRPGLVLELDKEADGKRKRKPASDKEAEVADATNPPENARVWAGRRILLSTSLELSGGSRRAIETGIQRAGGLVVPIAEDAEEDEEEKAVDGCDVLVTRWRGGKSYFKAVRASLLIGTLSWLFSVESSGTLHSPLDSLLWYPTPRGGIRDLIGCEISITNYTGAARDYLKRLITLVGANFTPSMSQSNKILVAGFQPSPKTTRALSWSIPVVNHIWLEDCVVEWRALTVGLERYIVYPPGIDFGKILMTRPDGDSSQPVPPPRLSGGALPGGRGVGVIDVEQEVTRDANYMARERNGETSPAMHDAFANDTTTDGFSMILEGNVSMEPRARPRSRAGSLKKTPTSTRKRGATSTPAAASATGAFVDQVIELPSDDEGNVVNGRGIRADGKKRAVRSPSVRSLSRASSVDERRVEAVVRGLGGSSKDKEKGKGTIKDAEKQRAGSSKLEPRSSAREEVGTGKKSAPLQSNRRGRPTNGTTTGSEYDQLLSDAGDKSEASVPPRRATDAKSKTPVKSAMKPRPRSKSRSRPSSVLSGESEDEVRIISTKLRVSTKKKPEEPAKPKRGGRVEAQEKKRGQMQKKAEKDVAQSRSSTHSPPPTSPLVKRSGMPKQRLSVLVPPMPKDYFSSSQRTKNDGDGDDDDESEPQTKKKSAGTGAASGSKPKPKQLAPAASIQAVAAEASASTSKRGRPSVTKLSTMAVVSGKSKPQAKDKPKPSGHEEAAKTHDEDMGESEIDDDVSMAVDTSMTSTSRGGPRRGAASKATARLKQVMPDVINFEKEQKQTKRRRSMGGESVVSAKERDEEREMEKDKRGGKRRKVAKESEEDDDDEAEVEEVVAPSVKAKSKQVNGKGKAKVTITVSSDETDGPPAKSKPGGPVEKNGVRGRGKESSPIRLMTTGVSLVDDVVKRLTKLGVQMTTKPIDCTHLIAKGFVRTEKFLCAMSVSPYVLTEEWANASAKGGKLLDEKNYLLSDTAAEQKWEFKFADAMKRAKGPEGGSNLFKQMTFYVTPKVSVDTKLLKNVVSAGGGQVQTSVTPTARILKGKANRYVVSCMEDKTIWRGLADEGFKVYSLELILRGALRQEIEWERKECLVAG